MKSDWNLFGHGLDWSNQLTWPVKYKFTYQAKLDDQMLSQLPEPKLIPNATVYQDLQGEPQNQMSAANDFYYQYLKYTLAAPSKMSITGITCPSVSPLKLPEQPRVHLVYQTFHLLDTKHRLMCTGRYNTYLETEILSDRDSHTAVTRFQKFFCQDCATYLGEYAAAEFEGVMKNQT